MNNDKGFADGMVLDNLKDVVKVLVPALTLIFSAIAAFK